MHTRAIALMTIMFTTQCSEWIPATAAEAIGQEHVRAHEKPPLDEPSSTEPDVRVVTTELAFPSRRDVLRLHRRGDHFEVRRSTNRFVVPIVLAIVGTAALAWAAALAAQYKPSFDIDVRSLGGLIRPP
jgi:hypothetical protein